jgi:hypothetical protein
MVAGSFTLLIHFRTISLLEIQQKDVEVGYTGVMA